MITASRLWSTLTVLAAALAVAIELVLVIMGLRRSPVMTFHRWGSGCGRFVSFFTVQSNLLVIITVLPLIMESSHDGRRWLVLRLDGW